MCVYVYIYRMELSNIYIRVYIYDYIWMGMGITTVSRNFPVSECQDCDRDNFMTPEEAKDPSAAVPDHRLTMI